MLSNTVLYTARRQRIALALTIQGEYAYLIHKKTCSTYRNECTSTDWVSYSAVKKKKKLSLVYHHQAHMLIAYLLPGWKGRKEYMIKRQRYSRLSQPTSVNKHVFIWSPFLLHFPFLIVAFCISRGRKAFLRLFLVVAFGSFSQISLIMFFNKSSR